MVVYRSLSEDDNIDIIADWIYQTDQMFNFLFKNKDNAIKAISKLILSDTKNLYHRDFITVASEDNNILGIVISYMGCDFSYSEIIKAFLDTNCSSRFRVYMFTILDEILASYVGDNEYYIGILYVNPKFRHNKMGSKLVNYCINIAKDLGCDCVKLDVESFKKSLPNFYSKFGFKQDSYNFFKLFNNNYKHGFISNIIAGICISYYFGLDYGCYGMKLDLK
ncbi:hypothetical protein BGI41_00025 [Methanobrevibacter sp. 87.7]|uniref:GNAT family N-acetyltransferase n=1 Tax=Methanobrevibacter sp. 87.7 TaxID=387957 RepID=UPI000B51338B|nr:GNAT family N-acetyltransferase [Methanobrevibacter sp. 87.7]OWT33871.1 hypothetical protein BGI41_00025 [Methanobrevibacter sp. 87.7]